MIDASTTGAEVEALAKRLRLTAAEPREMPNHRIRRYHLERLEASYTLRALVAERDAAIQRAEAADSLITELRHRYAAGQVALTEARAKAALAWEAGRDAATKRAHAVTALAQSACQIGFRTVIVYADDEDCAIGCGLRFIMDKNPGKTISQPAALKVQGDADITPPADLSAALTARLDAEWNAAYLAGFMASGEGWNGEYPFSDHGKRPDNQDHWLDDRDEARALRRAAPTEGEA